MNISTVLWLLAGFLMVGAGLVTGLSGLTICGAFVLGYTYGLNA